MKCPICSKEIISRTKFDEEINYCPKCGFNFKSTAIQLLESARLLVSNKEYEKAAKYYILACKKGNAIAMMELSTLYKEGLGVPKNEFLMKYCLQRAAEAGCQAASDELDQINGLIDIATFMPEPDLSKDLIDDLKTCLVSVKNDGYRIIIKPKNIDIALESDLKKDANFINYRIYRGTATFRQKYGARAYHTKRCLKIKTFLSPTEKESPSDRVLCKSDEYTKGNIYNNFYLYLYLGRFHRKLLSSMTDNSVYSFIIRCGNRYQILNNQNYSFNQFSLAEFIKNMKIFSYSDAVNTYNDWIIHVIMNIMNVPESVCFDRAVCTESMIRCIKNKDYEFTQIRGVKSEFAQIMDERRKTVTEFVDYLKTINSYVNKSLLDDDFDSTRPFN